MKRDALDQLTEELFAAAREERPDPELLARVLAPTQRADGDRAAADGSGLRGAVGAPSAELEPARPHSERRRRPALPRLLLAALAAVAAGAALLGRRALEEREVSPVISAEHRPSRAVDSRSETVVPAEARERPAVASVPARPRPAPRPQRPSSAVDRPALDPAVAPPLDPALDHAAQPDTRARFAAELHLLQQAQGALRAGDARQALTVLDRYSSELHGASLNVEETVLRIQTLIALGREPEAQALAQRFVQEHPDDPLVDRVRSFLRGGPAPSGTRAPEPRSAP